MISTKPLHQTLKIAGLAASVSLASLVISPTANAVSFKTNTASFSGLRTELTDNPAAVLTVDKYTPLAGETVTQVIIRLSTNLSTSGTVKNNNSSASTFRVTAAATQFDFNPVAGAPSPLIAYVDNNGPLIPISGTFGTQQIYNNVAPGATRTFPTQIGNGSTSITFDSSNTNLSEFLGSGSFSLEPTTLMGFSLGGGGNNVDVQLQTVAASTLEVEYVGTFTPPPADVPEPSSILGILALTGSGAAMMRKFKSLVKLA
ncbi:hypothetical protein Cylst_3508 [Cylindrospermum stagnale PCC 7417]|uniref:PEP-CTERM exosortase interaction domain-containing protein n=1 Tax=Cylindrospermum stagnale PCC 7417 TaxID=56107 RepID=K9WZM1_9NOST|nr:choice-of-anchor E domain-containing protein [Cylindrospermum stagnale]AFZ25648.1 hypothetical protein Cylst_3508 [Cylindrospermum stagnale PCC 7417]